MSTQYEELLDRYQRLVDKIRAAGGEFTHENDEPIVTLPAVSVETNSNAVRTALEKQKAVFDASWSNRNEVFQAELSELAKLAADAREQLALVSADRNELRALVDSLTAPPKDGA